MPFVAKQTFEYHPMYGIEPLASFSFEVITGVGVFMHVEEHRGILQHTEAEALIRKLHGQNLKFSWLVGLPGLFPLLSYLSKRSQMKRIRRQAAEGSLLPIPGEYNADEERKRFNAFLVLAALVVVGCFGWWFIDPESFNRLVLKK